MALSESVPQSGKSSISRRKVVTTLAVLPGVAGMWRLFGGRLLRPRGGARGVASPSNYSISDGARELMKTYPSPTWLPGDFVLSVASDNPRLRFQQFDGSRQLGYVAGSPSRMGLHDRYLNSVILISIAPIEADGPLLGLDRRPGVPLTIMTADGRALHGEHYKGANGSGKDKQWDTQLGDAVVVARDGFRVAVFSFAKNEVSLDDIKRVAASVA